MLKDISIFLIDFLYKPAMSLYGAAIRMKKCSGGKYSYDAVNTVQYNLRGLDLTSISIQTRCSSKLREAIQLTLHNSITLTWVHF